MPLDKLPHIVLTEPPETNRFTTPPTQGGENNIPVRNRIAHGQQLQQKFELAWQESEQEYAVSQATRNGVYIEFRSDPGADLVTKSLEEMRSKQVRLLNVRTVLEEIRNPVSGAIEQLPTTYATVYVANNKKRHFITKFEDYLANDTAAGNPKNQSLVDSITDIRKALLVDSFWTNIWAGTAAELATSNLISVTPTTGWWKERDYLGRWNQETRYTLIVSITTPDETVDVYTPVAVQVGVPVEVKIEL